MRIGLDLDGVSELRLLMAYFNLARLGRVEVERSPRRKGYHLCVRRLPHDPDAEYVVRSWLGDDPNRIRFDQETEHKPKQVLFQVKWDRRGRRHQSERLDERSLLAPPFLSRIHGGYFRRWRNG